MTKTENAVAFKLYYTCVVSTPSLHTVGSLLKKQYKYGGSFICLTCTNLNYVLSYVTSSPKSHMSQVKQLEHMCFSLYAEMHQSVVKKKKASATSCVITYYIQSVCLQGILLLRQSSCPLPFFIPAEELLNNFAQQTGAWRHCLFFLSNTRNEYVMMYSLTVFEVSAVRLRCVISQKAFPQSPKTQFLILCKLREKIIDPAVIHLNIENFSSSQSSARPNFYSPHVSLLQNLVNKMWIGVASQDKMEIRSCLPKLLLAQQKSVPYFIRNKLCKVIVDIGRQDWPMFYHDFFTNTLQVCSSSC